MQGEPESLLEKFIVGINTVGKGRREGDKAGLGAGNGGGAAPPHPLHRARDGIPPWALSWAPAAKREKGGRNRVHEPELTPSPEESLGCLFKSPLKPQQISHCPFKTKTNLLQKILKWKVLTFLGIFFPIIFFPVSPIHPIWH